MKLSQTLYARAEKIWPRYLCHPFVTQMADGTLPPEKFRYYMLQDYLYLKDYVKIFAAIIQKADDFEQIRFLSGELADTIGETFRTHIPYMKRLGITEEEIRSARPHMDNSAYTHYLLWEAQTGDVLTGLVTLLNCSWSYAYVAEKDSRTLPGCAAGHVVTARGSRATFQKAIGEPIRCSLTESTHSADSLTKKQQSTSQTLRKVLPVSLALLGHGLRYAGAT